MKMVNRLGMFVFVMLLAGCSLELNPLQTWNSLSVKEYHDLTANSEAFQIVPVADADSIDFGWETSQDSNGYWWNLNGIAVGEHKQILDSVRETLGNQGYVEKTIEFAAKRIPENWSRSLLIGDWPIWWKTDTSIVECVTWERETNSHVSTRSQGWVVRYDGKSQVSIWHFDRQHSWFGWSDEQRIAE